MAFCGTATSPSTVADPAADPAAPSDLPVPAAEVHPLRYRIWERFCAGESRSAIARAFQLDRETVSRHIRAVEALLAEEQQLEMTIALWRAVEAQCSIQRTALRAYDAESAREEQAFAPHDSTAAPRLRYRAQRARLLTIAGDAAWHVARLYGLPARTAPPSAPSAAASAPIATPAEAEPRPE